MPQIPIRPSKPTSDSRFWAQVTDDGSQTIVDRQTGATYHSGCGAAAETRTVYLENSQVATALAAGQPTRVLEFGLGTGMGMLMTVDLAAHHGCQLDYVAIEREWLSSEITRNLNLDVLLSDPNLTARYHDWRQTISPGSISPAASNVFRWQPSPSQSIDVLVMDGADAANDLQNQQQVFDAIYFDPFDPATNPEAWQSDIITAMHPLLAPHGCLVSYCVNRVVRDTFAQCGFNVTRVPGPQGGKREVLVACPTDDGSPGNANLIRKR